MNGPKRSGALHNFWSGKAPRPDLMGGPTRTAQRKPLSFWADKAPRPDLMPARMSGAVQRMEDVPAWKPPLAVGIGSDWRFDQILDEEDFHECREHLETWSTQAKKQMKIAESVYEKQRSEIEDKVCTPETWTKFEETACVCDDLIDALTVPEVRYTITYQGVVIGFISFIDGYRYYTGRPPQEGVNLTGLVKKPDAPGSLAACIPKFLSILLKKTNKRGIDVASAKGALTAYGRYGFISTGQDANHFGHVCGCTVLVLRA